MKLIYRGIKYEHAPATVEVTTAGVCGKYRGAEWKCHYSQYTPVTDNAVELKYRGVSYYSGNPEKVEELKKRKKLNFIFGNSNKISFRNRVNANQLNQTHQQNLLRNVQRRLEVAKRRGDENLIRILQDEVNQLSN
ncbi:hypothetical protein Riv7116_6850 [Rivularia sp. PCC 7116]|uniref:arginine synthesis PII-interacting regulator PirA n=1 Tax=Rivularia sp. PCC 7116 TaxID=373994 RepID=UPI00029F4A22|nr:DUF4278 domain-containing protein [Rivularia sp. PCC 7116]AFY59165.1 hypothetical protein Riv7116_6850 [Rivularia sp. PCC 7116]